MKVTTRHGTLRQRIPRSRDRHRNREGMVQLLASSWPGARLIAWPAYANSRKRRNTRGAEDAMRSIILGHGHITLPAYREGLTYRVFSAEQGKSAAT